MKIKNILFLLVLFTGLLMTACDDDDNSGSYYIDHVVKIVDGQGSPFPDVDVYLNYQSDDDKVLLSKQITNESGEVYFKKSYLGKYTIEVGYKDATSTKEAGEFDLQQDSPREHSFTMPSIFEVKPTLISVGKNGLLPDDTEASFHIISTESWNITSEYNSTWVKLSATSGEKGKTIITLKVNELDGAPRGEIFTVKNATDESFSEKVYVEQAGDPYFNDNLDWLAILHPNASDFLNNQSATTMVGWGSDSNYHGWTRYIFTSAATYCGLGYFKISTSSRGGGVTTPKMEAIGAGNTENVRLTFDIAKYIPASGAAGTGEVAVDIIGGGTFQDGTTTKLFQAGNTKWNVFDTKNEIILDATSQTQFSIRAPQVSGNYQFLLDNVKVEKVVFI